MALNNKIFASVKQPAKFILSRNQRQKVYRESSIKKQQNHAIKRFDAHTKKLIVFLLPGADPKTGAEKISGGVISIISLCEESVGLKNIHHAEVVASTLHIQPLLFKHNLFQNNTDIFRFNQLRKYFKDAEEILFHLPEFACEYFLDYLGKADKRWLGRLKSLHINILNQNISLMPSTKVIAELKALATKITMTTAHQRYCTMHYRRLFDVPLHKFSVWISPEKYTYKQFDQKENLIVVSPDEHPLKQNILNSLSELSGLTIQIIQGLTYEQYKTTIAKAKWALTFGEGLDGYIIEPIFSGAIGFAVYNEEFFTVDFKNLETIYESYEQMFLSLKNDIKIIDNKKEFTSYQKEQFEICALYYNQLQYRRNIEEFYKGNYTFN